MEEAEAAEASSLDVGLQLRNCVMWWLGGAAAGRRTSEEQRGELGALYRLWQDKDRVVRRVVVSRDIQAPVLWDQACELVNRLIVLPPASSTG